MSSDLSALAAMKYSGRSIVLGRMPDGASVIGYAISGRQPSSQARTIVAYSDVGLLHVEPTDPDLIKTGSPALLLYPAIIVQGDTAVVSNGAQTQLLYDEILHSPSHPAQNLRAAMELSKWSFDPNYKDKKTGVRGRMIDLTSYEPDDPNFTPRISGAISAGGAAGMHIVRRDKHGMHDESCHILPYRTGTSLLERRFTPSQGNGISTYAGGNESPLAPYKGVPFEVRIGTSDIGTFVEELFHAVQGEGEFAVAACGVKYIGNRGGWDWAIKDRHSWLKAPVRGFMHE